MGFLFFLIPRACDLEKINWLSGAPGFTADAKVPPQPAVTHSLIHSFIPHSCTWTLKERRAASGFLIGLLLLVLLGAWWKWKRRIKLWGLPLPASDLRSPGDGGVSRPALRPLPLAVGRVSLQRLFSPPVWGLEMTYCDRQTAAWGASTGRLGRLGLWTGSGHHGTRSQRDWCPGIYPGDSVGNSGQKDTSEDRHFSGKQLAEWGEV